MKKLDFNDVAEVYDLGRALPQVDGFSEWRLRLVEHFGGLSGQCLLDLGSGTGLFSAAIAEWFETRVVGVEPSSKMREVAAKTRKRGGIVYVGGRGEQIPLEDASCAAAWLSHVLHHLTDLARCAMELRRVVREGQPVVIRNILPGRTGGITLFHYFPGARQVVESSSPSLEAACSAFTKAGFELHSLQSVRQITAPDMRVFLKRVRVRADSSLAPLDDDQFAKGLRALIHDAKSDAGTAPIVDSMDMLVFH